MSVALIILVSGCTSKQSANVNADRTVNVRVGYFANITHAQALVGKQLGIFENALKNKANVKWNVFNAGPSEVEALLAGELDIAYIGPGPAINGYSKSEGDLKIIAGATSGGAILVSRSDLVINDVSELDGKRVAIPQYGNTQDLSLRNILEENGLKDATKGGTVEIRQASNADVKTLLSKGDIDAALVPEPWGSILVKEIGANIVLDNEEIWRAGNYSTALILVRTEFLNEHADVVEEFLRAHVQITDYINNNSTEAKVIINNEIKQVTKKSIAEDILNSSFDRVKVTYNPQKDSILEFINVSKQASYLKTEPDVSGMFDFSILNKILNEMGGETYESAN